MSLLEEERNEEAYQYAKQNGEIGLNRLIRLRVSPSTFRSICYSNGYYIEQSTKMVKSGRTGRRPVTIFYLIQRAERRYINGVELAACSIPKTSFIVSSGEYKCLHYKYCQCFLNGNCDIGG